MVLVVHLVLWFLRFLYSSCGSRVFFYFSSPVRSKFKQLYQIHWKDQLYGIRNSMLLELQEPKNHENYENHLEYEKHKTHENYENHRTMEA